MAPIPRSPMSTTWVFTLNNPHNNPLTTLLPIPTDNLPDRVTYLYYAKEVGATGTPHLQGYLELSQRVRRTWLIANIPFLSGAFVEVARGTAAQNKQYIEKAPLLGPFEYGTPKTPSQGKRNELLDIQQKIKDGLSDLELMLEFPSTMARYPKYVSSFRSLHLESLVVDIPFAPRQGWQQRLAELLILPPPTRTINWIYSNGGNVGKSYFANNWSPKDSYVVTGGKHADIFYSLSTIIHSLKTVFFDYARMQEGIPYAVMECLKNGRFTSTKYESRTLKFNPVHVVIFSNATPDLNVFSLDRWNIVKID